MDSFETAINCLALNDYTVTFADHGDGLILASICDPGPPKSDKAEFTAAGERPEDALLFALCEMARHRTRS